MADYLYLKTVNRKIVMREFGFYQGEIDSKRNDDYYEAVQKVNIEYLPSRYHKKVYYRETDRVLRSLRNFVGIKYFTLSEFKCTCKGKYCSGYPAVIDRKLVENLDNLRKQIGKPVNITCGLRCSKHNNSLEGSVVASKHTKGKAADIYVKGVSDTLKGRKKIMKKWKNMPGYGYTYCNENGSSPNMGNAVHVDVK